MPSLSSSTVTYTYDPDELKKMFAAELKVPEDCVKVRYVIEEVGGQEMGGFRGTDTVTRIEVTVDQKRARIETSEWGQLDR